MPISSADFTKTIFEDFQKHEGVIELVRVEKPFGGVSPRPS
jgi:hypothetical protein